jgi:glycine cleavage system H protein
MTTVRGFEFPDELFYMVEHDMWARLEDDQLVTVGLTALGCRVSGEFIEFMPKPIGTAVERDRALAVREMSKTIRSARAPAAGTIVAINDEVRRQPQLLNRDPYGGGWLVRLRANDWAGDVAALTPGGMVAAAVERYMDLYLVPEFGSEGLPPA